MHISDLTTNSRNKLAALAVDKYFKETGIKMNKDWFYVLIRLGIYKDSDGFHLEPTAKYSFDELCEHPSLAHKT